MSSAEELIDRLVEARPDGFPSLAAMEERGKMEGKDETNSTDEIEITGR